MLLCSVISYWKMSKCGKNISDTFGCCLVFQLFLNLPCAHSGKFLKPRMVWPSHACMKSRKSSFIHFILDSIWGTSGTLLLYFATEGSHYCEAYS